MDIKSIIEHLEQQISKTTLLKQQLERERKALTENKIDLLLDISTSKENTLQQIAVLDRALIELLKQDTFSTVSAFIFHLKETRHPAYEQSSALLETLKMQLHEIKRLNEINGKVINLTKHNRDTLESLLKGTHNQPDLYTAKGTLKTSAISTGHIET